MVCEKTVIIKGVCSKCISNPATGIGEKKDEHPVDTPTPVIEHHALGVTLLCRGIPV
jgi:hypothetical protein